MTEKHGIDCPCAVCDAERTGGKTDTAQNDAYKPVNSAFTSTSRPRKMTAEEWALETASKRKDIKFYSFFADSNFVNENPDLVPDEVLTQKEWLLALRMAREGERALCEEDWNVDMWSIYRDLKSALEHSESGGDKWEITNADLIRFAKKWGMYR